MVLIIKINKIGFRAKESRHVFGSKNIIVENLSPAVKISLEDRAKTAAKLHEIFAKYSEKEPQK